MFKGDRVDEESGSELAVIVSMQNFAQTWNTD